MFTELGSPTGIAHSLCCLGYAEIQLRHTVQAREHLTRAFDIAHATGRPDITSAAIEGLACTCAATNPQTSALPWAPGEPYATPPTCGWDSSKDTTPLPR